MVGGGAQPRCEDDSQGLQVMAKETFRRAAEIWTLDISHRHRHRQLDRIFLIPALTSAIQQIARQELAMRL